MSEHDEAFRDRIATVNEQGKRVWIFPKKPSGSFYNKRKIVSYLLLGFLFAGPHLRIEGEPFLMLNIIERKFVILGQVFWPQDMYILAVLLILAVVFVILFTIIYGRIFCGWVCPQTIFMEMVFRRIEYFIEGDAAAQRRLDQTPWNAQKIFKKVSKHVVFWLLSFLIANTFLAYIIGSDELWKIQTDPLGEHLWGFIALVIFTYAFYGVFAFLREQVCTTICPYGRLQGVLLDQNSMVVAYDHVRGENRAKIKKGEDRKAAQKGDCIDCLQCVQVCPTGIDIRNGTQLECINCTACIDVCDHMMEAVGQEKGLVRFVSEEGIKTRLPFQWTRRVKAYSILLLALLITLVTLIVTREDFQTTLIRQRGSTYQMDENGHITNIYEVNLLNKTQQSFRIKFKLENNAGEIQTVKRHLVLQPETELKERLIIRYPRQYIGNGTKKIKVLIYGNGKKIQTVKTKFFGPIL
jgi:cytochrome c oxidase accessory protein FixG